MKMKPTHNLVHNSAGATAQKARDSWLSHGPAWRRDRIGWQPEPTGTGAKDQELRSPLGERTARRHATAIAKAISSTALGHHGSRSGWTDYDDIACGSAALI